MWLLNVSYESANENEEKRAEEEHDIHELVSIPAVDHVILNQNRRYSLSGVSPGQHSAVHSDSAESPDTVEPGRNNRHAANVS